MSRKPKRPVIGGLRPEGPFSARVCNYCYDIGERRPRGTWIDPRTKEVKSGCPGCSKDWEPDPDEESDYQVALDEAAWNLLGDQLAREQAGVATFEAAKAYVIDSGIVRGPGQGEEVIVKAGKHCRVCCGLAHRRDPGGRACDGCGERFAPECLPIATGMQSSHMAWDALEPLT